MKYLSLEFEMLFVAMVRTRRSLGIIELVELVELVELIELIGLVESSVYDVELVILG